MQVSKSLNFSWGQLPPFFSQGQVLSIPLTFPGVGQGTQKKSAGVTFCLTLSQGPQVKERLPFVQESSTVKAL